MDESDHEPPTVLSAEERVRGRILRRFAQTYQELLEMLAEEGISCGTPTSTDPAEALRQWHVCMSSEMPKVKYCNALRRILEEPPQRYLACSYRDATTAFGDVGPIPGVDLVVAHDGLTESARSAFWVLVDAMNGAVVAHTNHTVQRVPSRDEIQQNIQKHKQSRTSITPSTSSSRAMENAFSTLLADMAEKHLVQVDAPAAARLAEHARQTPCEELMERWAEMLQAHPELEQMVQNAQLPVLRVAEWSALPEEHAGLLRRALADAGVADRVCRDLQRLSGFVKVRSKMPRKVMGQIEKYAMKLADDIQAGKCDLANLELEKIGRDVLAGCNSEDMNSLAMNLGEILPSLQALHQQ